ncbi:MAG: heme-binding beta-barrel domain-containing protein [Pseudomonadota bacterium]
MNQTAIDFGPLASFIGTWTGSGIDTVPDGKGGSKATPFIQEITLQPIPKLGYGSQQVVALAYTCLDWATNDGVTPTTMFPVFEERGYWIWVAEEQQIVLQVANPRGLSMLAVGASDSNGGFKVTSDDGNYQNGYGVLVSEYLRTVAQPVGYEASVKLLASDEFHYSCNTILQLQDGSLFNQTDITTLKRY